MYPTSLYVSFLAAVGMDGGLHPSSPDVPTDITLIQAPFTPGLDVNIGNLSLANFTGSGALSSNTSWSGPNIDPTTRSRYITYPSAIGGNTWLVGDTVNLPQTIYGYVVSEHGTNNTFGSHLLPTPITLQEPGDQIDIGPVTISLLTVPTY